ncbi:unnamed protein product [Caenorhabditis angaria]|uniref:Receptor L-domain domain-containing protein n=1 Tax=Caenorhabditis angaria TaxID=860376 RepID=A0A9P1INW3_9PELO|nr:unnamed protein product [Caenorhabditis angaria]
MLSKYVICILLFIQFSNILATSDKIDCSGSEVSFIDQQQTKNITDKSCTHITGDIILKDLENVEFSFSSIRKIQGSIIIENMKNSALFLNDLISIDSGSKPAIIIRNNENFRFEISNKFRKCSSSNLEFVYELTENSPNPIDVKTYTKLYLAATGSITSPVFYIDNSIHSESCNQDFFKMLSTIMGFLGVVLITALFLVHHYGREFSE